MCARSRSRLFLKDLDQAFKKYASDQDFIEVEFNELLQKLCRPCSVLLRKPIQKRGRGPNFSAGEDLNHLGAHKINNCLGQALLAKRMGKKRVIAETGVGQHGVAAAAVAAPKVWNAWYMGEEDTKRQALNVFRMQ